MVAGCCGGAKRNMTWEGANVQHYHKTKGTSSVWNIMVRAEDGVEIFERLRPSNVSDQRDLVAIHPSDKVLDCDAPQFQTKASQWDVLVVDLPRFGPHNIVLANLMQKFEVLLIPSFNRALEGRRIFNFLMDVAILRNMHVAIDKKEEICQACHTKMIFIFLGVDTTKIPSIMDEWPACRRWQ